MARGQDSSWTVTDDPTSFLLDGWQDDATHRKADLLSAAEQKEAAERMLALEDFTARLGKLLGANPNLLPEVTLRYSGLTVVADALVGSQSLPSVRNSSLGMLKVGAPPSARAPAARAPARRRPPTAARAPAARAPPRR
jgi:hypothetical protein